MKIFLPEGLNLENEIADYEDKYHEKYCWLIHKIIEEYYNSTHFEGYVNLQSEILGHFLGEKYYTTIIQHLTDSNIIAVNKAYSPNRFSKSYRLLEKYRERPVISIEFDTPAAKRMVKKLNDWHRKKREAIPDHPVYQLLYENLTRVDFDYDRAAHFLEAQRADLSADQYNARKVAIDQLYHKDFFFTVDPKTGRAYNNITSLPRDFRQFLSYEGEPLIHLDIANSQPLLFCPLLIEYWMSYVASYAVALEEMYNYGPDEIFEINGHEFYERNLTAEKNPPTVALPNNIIQYIKHTQAGVFYDEFMNYLKQQGIKDVPSRNVFKEQFFKRVFFSTTERTKEYKYEKWLFTWMPAVSMAIDWHKRFDYKQLSINLQKTESQIMLEGVCQDLIDNTSSDVFFLTIHDSILCLNEDSELAKNLILEVFNKKYNLTPTIKQG